MIEAASTFKHALQRLHATRSPEGAGVATGDRRSQGNLQKSESGLSELELYQRLLRLTNMSPIVHPD